MKRRNSNYSSDQRKVKKQKCSEDAERIIINNSENLLPVIPTDVLVFHILPLGSLDWLFISKELHRVAIKYIVDDSRVLDRSNEMLVKAVESRNLVLLERLLSDDRYTFEHTLEEAIHAILKVEEDEVEPIITDGDLQVLYILIGHKVFRTVRPDSLLYTAIKKGWIDIVQHALAVSERLNERLPYISLCYKRAPVETIKLIRQDPRFNLSPRDFSRALCSAIRAKNVNVVRLLMQEETTDFNLVVRELSRFPLGLKLLLEDLRMLDSSNDYQLLLWRQVLTNNQTDCLQLILQDGRIDPNLYIDNYVLYFAARYASSEMVQLLLQDPRITPTKKPSKRNPMVAALKRRYKEAIDMLLNHPKIEPEWLDHAFVFLTKKGYIRSVKFALQTYKEQISDLAKRKAMHSAKKRGFQKTLCVLEEYK